MPDHRAGVTIDATIRLAMRVCLDRAHEHERKSDLYAARVARDCADSIRLELLEGGSGVAA